MQMQKEAVLLKRVMDTMDEAQQRWFVGREALRCGRGGIRRMCALSGLSKPTVIKGVRELQSGRRLRVEGRIRRPGAGRKRVEERDPQLVHVLTRIMEETTAGEDRKSVV